ncbi:MAG: hypothetical protein ABIR24_04490, partial [Verrucomicrobiota bacterium]
MRYGTIVTERATGSGIRRDILDLSLMEKILFSLIIILNSFAIHSSFAQDHGHLRFGAASTNQGAPLLITNAADFVTDSGYVKTLSFTNESNDNCTTTNWNSVGSV